LSRPANALSASITGFKREPLQLLMVQISFTLMAESADSADRGAFSLTPLYISLLEKALKTRIHPHYPHFKGSWERTKLKKKCHPYQKSNTYFW